ncbi:MAG TPA: vanadium-dependent haloperoxidase [Fimbriimonas sp.]
MVTDWNQIAFERIAAAGGTPEARPGPSNLVDAAAVQLAVYDAVQSYSMEYRPYLSAIPNATGSVEAAAATAARDVLTARFPLQETTITGIWENYMASHSLALDDPGCAVGAQAAHNLNINRLGDGFMPPQPWELFFGNNADGQWRSAAPMAAVWLADVRPFAVASADQFMPPPPPSLTSQRYLRDLEEVRLYGRATDSKRSEAQTQAAIFWNLAYQPVFARMVRELSMAHLADISQSSKLLAATSVSAADALITTWHAKKYYNYWRPSTHIQMSDSTWTPLLSNPPYQDYPSGANTLTASVARSAAHFFGTNEMAIEIKKSDTDVAVFGKFSDVCAAVVDARVWEGIHFRFADDAARRVGERVATWVHSHYFRPWME